MSRVVLLPCHRSEDLGQSIRLAGSIAGNGGRVIVLGLTWVHPALPLSDLPAHFDEPTLRLLCRAWHIVQTIWDDKGTVEFEPRLRRTHELARTILYEAGTSGVDSIVLPVKPPRFSWLPLRLDGTTRQVMRRSPCPVVLGHFPAAFSSGDVLKEAQSILRQHAM